VHWGVAVEVKVGSGGDDGRGWGLTVEVEVRSGGSDCGGWSDNPIRRQINFYAMLSL
jgi:hypothetical protein